MPRGAHNKLPEEIVKTVADRLREGCSALSIARALGIGRTTVKEIRGRYDIPRVGHVNRQKKLVAPGRYMCRGCLEVRDEAEYLWENSITKVKRQTKCKYCTYEQTFKRLNVRHSYILHKASSLKNAAKERRVPFSVDAAYLSDLLDKQDGRCVYTGVELVIARGVGHNPHSASVDKIVPGLGYVPGNIVFCTKRANLIKNDLNLDEFREWLPLWWQRLQSFLGELTCSFSTSSTNLICNGASPTS